MPKRLLIAEDNERVRDLIRSQIEQLPAVEVCATVANGIAAVEEAIALRPDLLILDVLMPKLNGIEVAGVLKKSLPSVQIILFTLYADAISPQTINALGVRVVSKTDGLRGLRRAMQETWDDTARQVDEGLTQVVRDRATDPVHLSLLTHQLSVPLTRCSRDLKYLWVNECYAMFLKRTVEKIAGRSILDIVGKSAFDLLQPYFDQVLHGDAVSYKAEVDYESAGHRHIAASYKPTFNNSRSPDGWLAYVEDLTPRASHASDPQCSPASPEMKATSNGGERREQNAAGHL